MFVYVFDILYNLSYLLDSFQETISNDSGIATLKEEILSMKISLNELGSASLGISVKGKTSTHDNCDLGIYVKSIIKGGAAFKVSSARFSSLNGFYCYPPSKDGCKTLR